MRTSTSLALFVILPVVAFTSAPAGAELEVSVSISGTIDELMPVLQHLKDMGIGVGAEIVEEDGAIKLEMHSVATSEKPAPPESAPAEKALALIEPTVAPVPDNENQVRVTVKAVDKAKSIDTVEAVIGADYPLPVDLYDNGRNGDEKARDGIWSRVVDTIDIGPGKQPILITAYAETGDPVMIAGPNGKGMPLQARTEAEFE